MVRIARKACSSRCCVKLLLVESDSILTQVGGRPICRASFSSISWHESHVRSIRFRSSPDTKQYVKFRLLVSGSSDELFDEECYALIHANTGGICREVSKLADNSLLEGYMRGNTRVTKEVVAHCIEQGI